MRMDRFKFNPETLSYQRIQPTGKQKFFRFLLFMGFALLLSVWILILRDSTCLSPF